MCLYFLSVSVWFLSQKIAFHVCFTNLVLCMVTIVLLYISLGNAGILLTTLLARDVQLCSPPAVSYHCICDTYVHCLLCITYGVYVLCFGTPCIHFWQNCGSVGQFWWHCRHHFCCWKSHRLEWSLWPLFKFSIVSLGLYRVWFESPWGVVVVYLEVCSQLNIKDSFLVQWKAWCPKCPTLHWFR